jgi:hypothetical protein
MQMIVLPVASKKRKRKQDKRFHLIDAPTDLPEKAFRERQAPAVDTNHDHFNEAELLAWFRKQRHA